MKDNIISLNPEFISFLLNPNADGQNILENMAKQGISGPDIEKALKQISQNGDYREVDPFDKVLLTKGIDNQILTSFRTLARTNNNITETLKIVHQKFQPNNQNVRFNQQTRKNGFYETSGLPLENTLEQIQELISEMDSLKNDASLRQSEDKYASKNPLDEKS